LFLQVQLDDSEFEEALALADPAQFLQEVGLGGRVASKDFYAASVFGQTVDGLAHFSAVADVFVVVFVVEVVLCAVELLGEVFVVPVLYLRKGVLVGPDPSLDVVKHIFDALEPVLEDVLHSSNALSENVG